MSDENPFEDTDMPEDLREMLNSIFNQMGDFPSEGIKIESVQGPGMIGLKITGMMSKMPAEWQARQTEILTEIRRYQRLHSYQVFEGVDRWLKSCANPNCEKKHNHQLARLMIIGDFDDYDELDEDGRPTRRILQLHVNGLGEELYRTDAKGLVQDYLDRNK